MGEVAEMMLEGILCECCGCAMIDGPDERAPGHPQRCEACQGAGDDDDDGDSFAAQRQQSQSKRRNNMRQSTDLLRRRGVKFEAKNNGVHLIVRQADRVFDFWPSTGRWIERDRLMNKTLVAHHRSPKQQGRGVFNLLQELGK